MSIDWSEVQKTLSPIKDYETLCRQFHESFGYPFVCQAYDFSLPELAAYTRRLLGGDPRQRYADYADELVDAIAKLERAGVKGILDLIARVDGRDRLEVFCRQNGLPAMLLASVLKYLTYWVVPKAKPLAQLARDEPAMGEAIRVLTGLGVRTNLDLVQQGLTPAGRGALAASSGLTEQVILEMVNRADLSRLPWASKATISNIVGAGYGSLERLAKAESEQLIEDYFAYGRSIGKDLRLGNEIDNSQRIARILPAVLQ